MAARSDIIATAAQVVLLNWDRRRERWRSTDETMVAAAAEQVGGTAADRASAEFFAGALIFMLEESGAAAVRDVLERHRLAGIAR